MKPSACHIMLFVLLSFIYCQGIKAQSVFETASSLAKSALNLELLKEDPLNQVRSAREALRTVYSKFFEGEGICLNMKWTTETIELDRQRQMLCQVERVLLGETANKYINPVESSETRFRSGVNVKYVWVKRAPTVTLLNITSAANSLNRIGGISAIPVIFEEVTTISDTFSSKTGGFDNYYDLQNKANLKNWFNIYGAKLFIGVVENTFSDGYWGVSTIGNCSTNLVNGTMVMRAANTNVSSVSLSIVMAHECGHYLGLVHDDPTVFPNSLMNPIVYDNANYMSTPNINCIRKSIGLFNTDVLNVANSMAKIYPTITEGILNLENINFFEIMDIFGHVVLKGKRESFLKIENLSKGFYFIHGLDLNNVPFLHKFVKL